MRQRVSDTGQPRTDFFNGIRQKRTFSRLPEADVEARRLRSGARVTKPQKPAQVASLDPLSTWMRSGSGASCPACPSDTSLSRGHTLPIQTGDDKGDMHKLGVSPSEPNASGTASGRQL